MRRISTTGITAAFTWLSLASGCDRGTQPPGPSLDERTFLSTEVLDEGETRVLVPETRLRLRFSTSPEGPYVSASAGCNSMSGTYAIRGGRFVPIEAGITEIGCDGDLIRQDDWYFGFLGAEPMLALDGDELTLTGDRTTITYLDQEVATPDLELMGPTWEVDTIIRGPGAGAAQWPRPATLVFDDKGTVVIDTGCNTGQASWELVDDAIAFGPAEVTEAACPDLADMLEAGVLDTLGSASPVSWEITFDRLSLMADEGVGLSLRARSE